MRPLVRDGAASPARHSAFPGITDAASTFRMTRSLFGGKGRPEDLYGPD